MVNPFRAENPVPMCISAWAGMFRNFAVAVRVFLRALQDRAAGMELTFAFGLGRLRNFTPSMNRRTTLADVAAEARCSKSTASLALRNDPRIPEGTRVRVQVCARALKYRPDPALSYIAARRWQTRTSPSGSVVAFITTNHPQGIFLDEGALRGARQQAEEFGYRLDHFRAEDYGDPTHLARVIHHRGIRGVIMGKLMREDFLAHFPWSEFCGVACDTGFYKAPLHLVMPDHSHAVKRAFHEASDRGYRRI
jgi:DNA-binding LacI/PurR family transcriptional regulator